MKGMELVGRTASNIASNTRYKVDEMTLQNRRREILNDFGMNAYALWLKGESFPEELDRQLQELQLLDNKLNDMRAARYETVAGAPERAVENAVSVVSCEDDAEKEEKGEQPLPGAPGKEHPESAELSSAIDSLFDEKPTVHEMAERVNSSLQQMSDNLRSFDTSENENESGRSNA